MWPKGQSGAERGVMGVQCGVVECGGVWGGRPRPPTANAKIPQTGAADALVRRIPTAGDNVEQ
jgi:hypothetical protein